MRTLRLHRAVYAPSAIDEAMRLYTPFAVLARRDDGDHVVLEVSADAPAREREVAGELGNTALGLTARGRR